MNRQRGRHLMTAVILVLTLSVLVGTMIVMMREEAKEKKPYRLIFVSKTLDSSNDFWTSLVEGAKLGAEEFGAKIEVTGGRSEADLQAQEQKIRESIKKKPDAILVAPCDYSAMDDALQEIIDAGIKLILIDSTTEKDIAETTVSTDNYRAGKELGEYAKRLLAGNSRVGIMGHVKGSSTEMEREDGIRAGLGDYESQIVDVVFCDSSYDKAYSLTTQMLEEHPDMDMIIATNEYGAVGSARAVQDMGMTGKVKMAGFDNSVEEIQLLEAGVFEGIIIQKPFNMGYLGVEQAIRVLEGKSVEKTLDSGCKLITRKNMYEEENQRLLYPFSGQ